MIVDSNNQDSDQYVNAGVHYGGALLWVVTKKLETLISNTAHPSEGEVTGLPDSLDQGQSAVVTATIATVQPSADISFSIFNPLGFDDIFDIGKPEIEIGSSFGCSETKLWKPEMRKSLSGNSVGYVDYNLPSAINTDSARDVNKVENKIQIKFSLTAMKGVDIPGQYVFSVALKVGIDDVITVTQDIIITESVHSPTVGSGEISLGQPKLLGKAYAGGTAAFQIDVTVPAGKSFELKTSGSVTNGQIEPSGLAILSTGVCSGFLQQAIFDNSLASNFGIVTNADSSPSIIEVMVVMTLTDAATGQISEAITIDGVSATMTGTISPAPAEVEGIVGTATGLGIIEDEDERQGTNKTIMPGYAVGIRSEVNLPASVLNRPLTLGAFQESEQVDYIRLCRVEVEHVGLGHPCTIPFKDPSFAETHTTLSKSVDTMKYEDTVSLSAGNSCPVGVPNDPKVNASLVFSFYYDIPIEDKGSVDDWTDFVLGGGLYVDKTALWTTNTKVYKIAPTTFTGMEAWDDSQTLIQPYMTARIINKNAAQAGLAIRFVIKINKFTRGNISFALKAQPDEDDIDAKTSVICSLRVVRIGKNFGCTKSPEEYTRSHVWSKDGHAGETTYLEVGNIMNYGAKDLQSNMYADDDSIELLAFFRKLGSPSTPIEISATLNGQQKTISYLNDQALVGPTPGATTGHYPEAVNFELITIKADETLSRAPLHAAKTIVMEVTYPEKWNILRIWFRSNDADFTEKITMCSLQVTKVGKNLPCLSYAQHLMAIQPKYKYTDKVAPESYITLDWDGWNGMAMDIDICHFEYSRDPEENKFQVEFTFKPTKKAKDGDIINIVGEVKTTFGAKTTSKTQSITLSNSVLPSNILISKSIFPKVMENTTAATLEYDDITDGKRCYSLCLL